MKTIVTLTMNPAIDKSSSVGHVIAEHKLYCKKPQFEPGGGGINVTDKKIMNFVLENGRKLLALEVKVTAELQDSSR